MGQSQSTRDDSERSQSVGRLLTVNPTLDFPFLQDDGSIQYINGSKIMFILRGLPGSGKTTLSHALQATYRNITICSSDDLFTSRSGIYQFNGSRLQEAHEKCQNKAFKVCHGNQFNVVIIDNTNIQAWETEFYFQLAADTNFVALLVEPKTSWRWDIGQLERKNVHNISYGTLKKKLDMYEQIPPIYFGWFLNEADSQALHSIAQVYLDECSRNRDFKLDFSKYATHLDLKGYFFKNSFEESSRIFHCTSNHSAEEPDGGDYSSRKSVLNSRGKTFQLTIVGFFITPRTFGARIKLNESCLKLWNQKDFPESNVLSIDALANEVSQLKLDNKNKNVQKMQINKKRQNICIPTLHWKEKKENFEHRFSPTWGKGSRAHITLGCANNIKASQAGYDLVSIVRLEKRFKESTSRNFFHVQNGVACNYGEGLWSIYLNKEIETNALFSARY